MKTRNFILKIGQLYPAKGGNTRQNCQGQINSSCFNLKANLFFCHFHLSPLSSRQWWVWAGDHANAGEWDWSVRIFTVKLPKHSHQRTEEQIAIVTSTRIKGMFFIHVYTTAPQQPQKKTQTKPQPRLKKQKTTKEEEQTGEKSWAMGWNDSQ